MNKILIVLFVIAISFNFSNAQTAVLCTTCGDPVVEQSAAVSPADEDYTYTGVKKTHQVGIPSEVLTFYSDDRYFYTGTGQKIKTNAIDEEAVPVIVTKPGLDSQIGACYPRYLILVFQSKDGHVYNAYYNLKNAEVTAIDGF